eukprot:CAMPEP_0172601772 /NCGR_PEP_ID=MMETSP1068-20121228/21948_1 /TAXON_ID=35684 /ORGANISM="Pseudopedinella elastica, Strain CCMP716" /LENGTH=33 /DNA_ID= /DNA_START= /DNA_END= /DNA_ORIENTATION=
MRHPLGGEVGYPAQAARKEGIHASRRLAGVATA